MADTTATNYVTVSVDMPDWGTKNAVFTLLEELAIADNGEVVLQKVYTLTLDAAGVGTINLPVYDTAGTGAWGYKLDAPDRTMHLFVLSGDPSSQSLGTILASAATSQTPDAIAGLIANKQDKVPAATLDNFAAWDAAGQTKDSGSAAGSFDQAGSAAAVAGDLTTHEGLTGTAVHGLGTASTSGVGDFDAAGSAAAAQAFSIQRANHTGNQLASTISDFAATVRSTVITGLSTATATVITAADTVLTGFGKLQAQISGHVAATGTAVHGLGTMAAETATNYYATSAFSASPTAAEPLKADGSGGITLGITRPSYLQMSAFADDRFYIYLDKTTATNVVRRGYYAQIRIASGTETITQPQHGLYSKVLFSSGGNTVSSATGTQNEIQNATNSLLGAATGVNCVIVNSSTGSIGTATGVNIEPFYNTGGGTITTGYGVRVGNISVAATNYAIYTGLGTIRFGDRLQVDVPTAATIGQIIKLAASQTANGFEQQTSAGAVQFALGSSGEIQTNQDAANTNTPGGATAHQIPVYNEAKTLLGYIPVYAAAW